MIRFKPVRLEDRTIIERYTLPSEIHNCDLAFANMYCWQFVYHSAWAEVDGFLVIRFQIGGGEKIGYMQPVGEGDFSHILPALAEDAHAHGQRLRLIGLTEQGCDRMRIVHPGIFAFESDRAFEDYLYRTDDLRNLTGKRYQPKRNHINRFTTEYPDYRYEELTPDRFGECMELERQWRRIRENVGHTSELCAEQRAMQRAFEHFEEMGMIGGCIYVADKLIAFTYGSAVNNHTFVTHVEKADTAYEGTFTIINKLFAEHLPPQYTLINREEDLGIGGLRHSKLSYQPAFLQRKFTAIRLHSDEKAVKRLWMEAFGDGDDFIDSLLIRHYHCDRMRWACMDGGVHCGCRLEIEGRKNVTQTEMARAAECEQVAAGKTDAPYAQTEHGRFTEHAEGMPLMALKSRGSTELASMLHLIPFRSELGRTIYVYGVATATAARGRGLASKLLRAAEAECRERGDDALMLIPSDEGLRDFYARLGYEGNISVELTCADGFDFGTGDPAKNRAMVLPLRKGLILPEALHAAYEEQ